MDPSLIQLTTFGTALVGAVLGIVNFWRAWSADRARLRVSVSHAMGDKGMRGFSITVVNLSTFPLTVVRLGFKLHQTTDHVQLLGPAFTQGEELPVRLEPRASFTAVLPLVTCDPRMLSHLRVVYADTACGLTFFGGRKLLADLQK